MTDILLRRIEFTRMVRYLLDYAFQNGILVVLDEVKRPYMVQEEYVRTGKSATLKSDHLSACAMDLDVVENGKVITDGSHPSYLKLGVEWERMKGYWGGRWVKPFDARHFGYKGE